MDITFFVEQRLLDSSSRVHGLLRIRSALQMIAGVHREADGFCNGCDRPWPCATIRAVAWTWGTHPDYSPAWSTGSDYPHDVPLTEEEKT